MSSFKPTPEQEIVIDFIAKDTGSGDVDALAGAAKSTTLEMASSRVRSRKNLALAFNVSIKEALAKRMPDNFTVKTFNGLGHAAWGNFLKPKRLTLDKSKLWKLLDEACEAAGIPKGEAGKETRDQIKDFVVGARNYGLVPEGAKFVQKRFILDDAEGWDAIAELQDIEFNPGVYENIVPIARAILLKSIEMSLQGTIDFQDQIYMPCCFGGAFERYETLFADEGQDLSELNHYMIARSIHGGRLIAVGDERQSIYAFRGADHNSLPNLRRQFNTHTMALTTTFRCSQAVVQNVRDRAPEMKWAPWAKEGEVKHLGSNWKLQDLKPGSAIICRNNAPLFNLAFKLINAGISIVMLGSEMSTMLTNFVLKMADNKDERTPVDVVLRNLREWKEKELYAAELRNNHSKMDQINQKAEIIEALPGNTAGEMILAIEKVFERTQGTLTLCTGHKSKGLEFEHVYHLDSWRIPSKYAQTPAAKLQERNLRYVIDTRAKFGLYYIDLPKAAADAEA